MMCADRHWKLVYRWISAHITLLAEHPPISGSFMFLLCKNHPYESVTSVFDKKKIRVHQCHPWEKRKTAPCIIHEAVILKFNGYRCRYR